MTGLQVTDDEMRNVLVRAQDVAVVGVSARADRPSHYVTQYLIDTGQYTVHVVNPGLDEVLGRTSYPSLQALPVEPDLVVVFRRAQDLPPVLSDALAARARGLWIQLGIVNDEVAAAAAAAGLDVVMDRCIMVEHRRLMG